MIVLDISHHQKLPDLPLRSSVDMRAVKAAGCAAVVIRATYGTRPDSLAEAHNRAADEAELPRLFYWYNLTRRDPHKQADMAYVVAGAKPGRRGALDVEESVDNDGAPPAFPPRSDAYFHHVNSGLLSMDRMTGLTTMLYSSAGYLNFWFTPAHLKVWAARFLWIAQWNRWIDHPDVPQAYDDRPGRKYELWQKRIGNFPGVIGNVDINETHPNLSLAELLGQPPALHPVRPHLDAIAQIVSG